MDVIIYPTFPQDITQRRNDMVTIDLPFMAYCMVLVVFAGFFLSILLQGRHIGPRERFEWDEEIGG